MNATDRLAHSWIANAGNWTAAVRGGLIPSRKAGTDAAILSAITERRPKRLLDMGCGEGWLIRAVRAALPCAAIGIDGSPELVRDAIAADASGTYNVLTYDVLTAGRHDLGGGFDVIALNYALFEADVAPILSAARSLLTASGAVIIQTLHSEPDATDSWRTEDFAAFENGRWTPMPYYARSRASWIAAIQQAGLRVVEVRTPTAADGAPLSLLMICEDAAL